jgi:hypothetical protein
VVNNGMDLHRFFCVPNKAEGVKIVYCRQYSRRGNCQQKSQ